MNILSLFDGLSAGQLALERAGVTITNYYASEINKYAIKITQKNYPNTKQLGNVLDIKSENLPKVDLLMGGSPCQGFSVAGKGLNFEDPRSKLFFEFVRLLEETKPKYFLLENVKMKKEYQNIISKYLGVEPIAINSSTVSAQNRKRLYWTNISNITQPKDKGVLLKDIVLENESVDFEYLKKYIAPFDKTLQILDKKIQKGKMGYFGKDSQANRVYYINNKAVTLCGSAGGGAAKMGQYLFGCITPRFLDGYIRKLTPVECERLQTLPDNYTNGVSETQRYKMLGNCWTVDVLVHIFGGLTQ